MLTILYLDTCMGGDSYQSCFETPFPSSKTLLILPQKYISIISRQSYAVYGYLFWASSQKGNAKWNMRISCRILLIVPWASYQIRKITGCACRERFPPPPISKETASKPSWHASRHVRARAVMHVGIAYLRWRWKRSRHSRRMRTRNFAYLARGP